MTSRRANLTLLVAFLLLGATLRWRGLSEMKDILLYDEAFFGADALSLLKNPRFVPFFPANFGHESLWMYAILPSLVTFGAQPFAIRIASTTTGIVTLAAVYALAAEVLGKRGALWTVGALAVLYTHVHQSHIGFRSIQISLIGSLAFALLLRARRNGHTRYWLLTGLFFGLLAYTYFPSRLWIAVGMAMQTGWLLGKKNQRRQITASLILTSVILLPLLVYSLRNPQIVANRAAAVAAVEPGEIIDNITRWARAWLYQGSEQLIMNAPGRPILDVPLAVLFFTGLFGLRWAVKRRWMAGWVVGLGLLTIAPSILSLGSPNMIRAAGLVIPIAIIAGAGALHIERLLLARKQRVIALALPVMLLSWAGWTTGQDFARIVGDFAPNVSTERQSMQAIDYIAANLPESAPVYFVPLPFCYPTLSFRAASLASRTYGAFDPGHLLLMAEAPSTYYVVLPPEIVSQRDALSRWADVTPIYTESTTSQPGYQILQAAPHREVLAGWEEAVVWNDLIAVRALNPLRRVVRTGQNIEIVMAMRPLKPLERALTTTVRLEGAPGAVQSLLTPAENYLCKFAARPVWQPDEIIIQRHTLPAPESITPGRYRVVVNLSTDQSQEVALGVIEIIEQPTTASLSLN